MHLSYIPYNVRYMNQIAWQSSFFDVDTGYAVQPIPQKDTHYFLLNIHYAKRIPSINFAFGLFKEGQLVGVITYGMPASATVAKGLVGEQYADKVLELNRLCLLNNEKFEASRLVAGSLKLLPKPTVVISYADHAQNHEGIVYQATNFMYLGLTDAHKDWAVKGYENKHSRSFGHMFDGENVLQQMKDHFGDDFYYIERSRKHRYLMVVASKTYKKEILKSLRYEIQPYPKERVSNG